MSLSDKLISARTAGGLAGRHRAIYVAGCTAEPTSILDAVAVEPGLWRGNDVYGTFIPGVNVRDYCTIGTPQSVNCLFPTAAMRQSPLTEALKINQASYFDWNQYLTNHKDIGLAYVQVAPPDDRNRLSLGLTVDFVPSLLQGSCRLVGLINPDMPSPAHSVSVPLDRFDALVESDAALPEWKAGAADDTMACIARHVCSLLREGDVLQFGLGKLQQALLQSLDGREGLGLHGGMISERVPDLVEQGVFSKGVTTGVALGRAEFYASAEQFDCIRFKPVSYTHNFEVLSGIDQFVAINSVLEVDLLGRVNAEYLSGKKVTALGGMTDFVQGARASAGGRSILALPSTTRNGTVSRIVARLPDGQLPSFEKDDVQYIVTEHGVADMSSDRPNEIIDRLIAIAHPDFRQQLIDSRLRE